MVGSEEWGRGVTWRVACEEVAESQVRTRTLRVCQSRVPLSSSRTLPVTASHGVLAGRGWRVATKS